jgi:hypothetical protein
VVPAGEAERSALQTGLEAAAAASGYQFAGVDSAVTKIHMVEITWIFARSRLRTSIRRRN